MAERGWAIVTGASSGLGYVFVKELVRAGHPVLAVARRKDRLDQLAAEMAMQGGKVEQLAADLGSPEGVKAVVSSATGRAANCLGRREEMTEGFDQSSRATFGSV